MQMEVITGLLCLNEMYLVCLCSDKYENVIMHVAMLYPQTFY